MFSVLTFVQGHQFMNWSNDGACATLDLSDSDVAIPSCISFDDAS